MIKIVSAHEMRQMDHYTIQTLGIPGVVLMENAGRGVYLIIEKLLEEITQPSVHIFCGKGNNGGDGYVIARYLWQQGLDVQVWVVGEEKDIKGDAKINFEVICKLDVPVTFLRSKTDLRKISRVYADIVVDALLGTGISGAVHGLMKDVISSMNDMGCLVVSVDVPSGLNSDLPSVEGEAIQADFTVTMALPKICHVFHPARSYVGKLYIADIGIPPEVRFSPDVKIQMVEKQDVELPERPADAHKYSCGKVAILAGSVGYTGAATLASEAAMRMGAGLVILGIPEDLNPVLEMKLTEVITKPYKGEKFHSSNDPAIEELLDWCDVLAIGPGLGRSSETQQAIADILRNFKKPAIIDADALYTLAHFPDLLKKTRPNWILTPHHGEFFRLLKGMTKKKFSEQFITYAQKYSQKHELTLLLKGPPSFVSSPDAQVYVNSTGNPGLASGGTGDVLTGFVAALLGQGMDPVSAAVTATYFQGKCADELVKEGAPHSLLAGDLFLTIDKVLHDHLNS